MVPGMLAPLAAGIAATLFAAIALLHAYWAVGGLWPGHDRDSLARAVVGGPPGMAFPGAAATWAVVLVLAAAAVVVLAAAGLLTVPAVPPAWARGAAWLGAAVLLGRGLAGFVDTRLRPETVGSPFARLNVVIYSPLCLALAALTFLSAVRR
jgi:hypothetical protein